MISLDTRQQGMVLSLRKSMIKFEGSQSSDLEICGSASRPLPLYLNRQFIKILEDLQIDTDSIVQLQHRAVQSLKQAAQSPPEVASFLTRENICRASRLPGMIRKLYSLGFDFSEDQFLRSVVDLAIITQLRDIKYRSRILVEQGVTLYGIMDETDSLAEGEIYCSTDTDIIVGRVAITRAPALHPGDIQIAKAVDMSGKPPLGCLKNCVVFSQRGARDLPSQLSGGDLDGDLYNVIYDPRLIPTSVVKPADYPRVRPMEIDRPIVAEDISRFFIDFMENDQLGRIATLHMQLADRLPGGTHHADCKQLAELHSSAVDFSKSGRPVGESSEYVLKAMSNFLT